MPFILRPATLTDIPAITEIYRPFVEEGLESFELIAPDETEMTVRFNKVIEAHCPYLVAEEDHRILGYAYAAPFHARPAYGWSVEDSIYLSPSAQGRGIGVALLRALIEQCENQGFRQMVALITRLDPPRSISLHEAFGFRQIGVLENIGFKKDKWLDVVYMQRALGEAATTPPNVKSR